MKLNHLLCALCLAGWLLLAGQSAPIAHAATLTVDPSGTNSGDCTGSPCATVTYAIGQAAGGDTINVAAGTYTEFNITVNKNLTITGAGADLTIVQAAATAETDGTGNRVFDINSGNTAVLENMTIQHGNREGNGGGIYNSGTLTVNNSTIAHNSADTAGGGIYNRGTLTVNNTTIAHNPAGLGGGGGIYASQGTVTVNNSTFAHNSGGNGGGIYNFATLTVNNSTITHNSATSYGGGISNQDSGTLTVNNSTIATNNWALFGGGISNSGTLTVAHTIIAGNTVANSGPNCSGTIQSQGYNLISNTAGCTISGDTTGNITGQNANLGPLQDNGGPTLTRKPNNGSPAIDNGETACGTALDQRGAVRPYNGNCDIGAVEVRETITQGTCDSGTPLSGSQTFTFNSGDTLAVNVNTAAGLDCIQVEEMGGNHLLATTGIETGNWWHITGNITSGFDVNVTLPHSGLSNPQVCKYPGTQGGYGWDCARTHYDASTVWLNGQDSFSDWAVGDSVGPTAVSLSTFSANPELTGLGNLSALLLLLLGVSTAVVLRRRSIALKTT